MSSKVINAVIALIEDRPQDAKEMLRSPELKVSSSELQSKLFSSLRKRENAAAAKALKDVLRSTLSVDADLLPILLKRACTEEEKEAFLLGICHAEDVVEETLGDYSNG